MEFGTRRARRAARWWVGLAVSGAAVLVLGLLLGGGLEAEESPAVPQPAPRALPAGAPSPVGVRPGVAEPRPAAEPEPRPARARPAVLERLLAAIRHVESMGGKKRVGDRGRSLGDYHIGRRYWNEATRFAGARWDYDTYVWSRRHCRQVMMWYWQRWCPQPLQRVRGGSPRAGDLSALARVHNGGPAGARKPATLRYWRRVQAAMNRLP